MINKLFTLGGLPVESKQEEKRGKFLTLNIQHFAEPGENPGNEEEEVPDLEKLLENPKFKEQYEQKFKAGMGERLKKYKNIDVDEYNRLKVEADKQQPNAETKKPENPPAANEPKTQTIPDEVNKALELSERRLKLASMKEFSANAELNKEQSELFKSLVSIKDVELNDDGEATNLNDLFEELSGKFPGAFATVTQTQEDGAQLNDYRPGGRQKMNQQKKVDPAEIGRQKALARHQKKED